ncbi:TPA: DUF3800 domain-containing protein [Escherichia coli]
MNIYIDESGSFVNAPSEQSWNTVVAYVSPEADTLRLKEILRVFKIKTGHMATDEVKMKNVSEIAYIDLLIELSKLKGIAFCVATDSGVNTKDSSSEHQNTLYKAMLANMDKMIYQSGRDSVKDFAEKTIKLSPQLYVQLYCQVTLIYSVMKVVVSYFAARDSKTLSTFRWRVDQKGPNRNDYEKIFEVLSPAFLQMLSINDPIITIREYDYSAMETFIYKGDEFPDYLGKDYGLKMSSGFNIGKIMRDDFKFVDSTSDDGVQVADLLSAGFRKCLRGGFSDNDKVSSLLGTLLVHDFKSDYPVKLLGFENKVVSDDKFVRTLNIMRTNARCIILA